MKPVPISDRLTRTATGSLPAQRGVETPARSSTSPSVLSGGPSQQSVASSHPSAPPVKSKGKGKADKGPHIPPRDLTRLIDPKTVHLDSSVPQELPGDTFQTPPQTPENPVTRNMSDIDEINDLRRQLAASQEAAKLLSMPARNSKAAPIFDPLKPVSLQRYLRTLEALFERCKITDGERKKEFVTFYVDADLEADWKELASFAPTVSYERFKGSLLALYPEARDAGLGSLAKLDDICNSSASLLDGGSEAMLTSFILKFSAEANRLMRRTEPSLASNKEIVDKFFRCITPAFKRAILSRLENISISKKLISGVGEADEDQLQPERRAEDRYTWKEVLDAAIACAGSIGAYSLRSNERVVRAHTPIAATEPPIEIKRESVDMQRALMTKIDDLAKTVQMLTANQLAASRAQIPAPPQQAQYASYQPAPGRAAFMPAKPVNEAARVRCHYCGDIGHFIRECVTLIRHVDEKKIIHKGGTQILLGDGSIIPDEPRGAPIGDRAMAAWNRKTGSGKVNMLAAYLQETEPRFSLVTDRPWDYRDDVIHDQHQRLSELAQLEYTNAHLTPSSSGMTMGVNALSTIDLDQLASRVARQWKTEADEQEGFP